MLPDGLTAYSTDGDLLDAVCKYEQRAPADVTARLAEAKALPADHPGGGNSLAHARKAFEAAAWDDYVPICPIFHLAARAIDRASGDASGYVLQFAVDDQPRQVVILESALVKGTAWAQLASAGFVVDTDNRDAFVGILRKTETLARVHIESAPGWYGGTFLAPTGEAITGPDTDDCTDVDRVESGPIGHALDPAATCDPRRGGKF